MPELGPITAQSSVAGIDDWAWRKGTNYGTIIVDLERRQVVGLLADRSAATTASWFVLVATAQPSSSYVPSQG
jgi:transposase